MCYWFFVTIKTINGHENQTVRSAANILCALLCLLAVRSSVRNSNRERSGPRQVRSKRGQRPAGQHHNIADDGECKAQTQTHHPLPNADRSDATGSHKASRLWCCVDLIQFASVADVGCVNSAANIINGQRAKIEPNYPFEVLFCCIQYFFCRINLH